MHLRIGTEALLIRGFFQQGREERSEAGREGGREGERENVQRSFLFSPHQVNHGGAHVSRRLLLKSVVTSLKSLSTRAQVEVAGKARYDIMERSGTIQNSNSQGNYSNFDIYKAKWIPISFFAVKHGVELQQRLPHTTIYVSSHMCVLLLLPLHMCPQACAQ